MSLRSIAGAALVLALTATGAQAWSWSPYGVNGNDTGGIIPWSPAIHHVYRDLAAAHCAGYNKLARITSVRRRYGDYIGFACYFPRYYDPVKAGVWWVY